MLHGPLPPEGGPTRHPLVGSRTAALGGKFTSRWAWPASPLNFTSTRSKHAHRPRDVVAVLGRRPLDGDGVVCLDLDHRVDEGAVAGWARRVLEATGDTWVEVSAARDGLHVWGLYGTDRYIAVTGWTHAGGLRRLGDLQKVTDSPL